MAVYTQVSAEAASELLRNYDAGELVTLKGIAEGVENSNYYLETTHSRYILTLYEKRVDPNDLPYFYALTSDLPMLRLLLKRVLGSGLWGPLSCPTTAWASSPLLHY